MKRCSWVNLNNPLYVKYHDKEWGKPKYNDHDLFELLILEMYQAGLSWECILNKRDNFRVAFDNFDYEKISNYNEKKIMDLLNNPGIIRNKLKINATINNAKIFMNIKNEYGSFANFIWSFTNNNIIKGIHKTSNELSDQVSNVLKQKGMKFVGSTIIYSYLQAIGVINDHDEDCDWRVCKN